MKGNKENFLDYIPKHNSRFLWAVNDQGHVEINQPNTGLFNRIAQLLFKRPKTSQIELEDFGSFVWQNMDGVKSVYDIGKLVKEEFGEKCEPLYERLSVYVKTLHNNEYIVYQNKINKN